MKVNMEYLWDYDTKSLDFESDAFKKWYIGRILVKGNLSDIKLIGIEEIKKILPQITVPLQIRGFWEWYLDKKNIGINNEHTNETSEKNFKHNIKSPFIKR